MAPALDISAPVVSSPPYEPNKSSVVSNVSDKDPEVVVYDWDKDELDIVGRCGLKYTIRSSKYPRTVQRPARTTILLNSAHAFSVHTILLTAFSKTLAVAISTQPTAPHLVKLKLSGPISSLPAWTLFLDWLYTLDKIPLPDFTPLRPPSTTTSTLVSAALLASHLHAVKFEKYLLRVIYKELWDGVFPVSSLEVLRDNMGHDTGMWYFSTAWFRWRDSGWAGELDPYRWRVEHWYSICGTLGNWGCFHAMNTSGWSGVWDRQRKLANEVDKKVVEEILEIGEGSGSDKDEKEQRHTDWDPTWNRNTGARRAGYDGVDEVDARDKAQAWRNGFHRRTRRGAHGAAQFSKVSFKGNTSEEVSGEEMWEEWWEDDDLYSRFGEGIDVDVDDIRLDGDGDD